jgi:sec-independent protein translocase protein TatB
MFDFAWSEIALIGVVALIAIGPKDMPVAIKAVSQAIKKMRRMAGEFQGHVDEMLREADLGDVQSTFKDLRSINLRGAVERAIDPDRGITRALEDPFRTHPVPPVAADWPGPAKPPGEAPPAFIPPGFAPQVSAKLAPVQQAAPAFVPPGAARTPGEDI